MRDSCIEHRARQPIAIVREDYYLLTGKDCVAAALLNIFEYWANSAIANNPDAVDPWLGEKTTKEFEVLLLGISTDKQIRTRLHILRNRGFIETRQPCPHRKTLEYRFMINAVQNALDEIKANGRTTAGSDESQRSNNRRVNGQTTAGSDESQRSNNRSTIYKKDQDQEDLKEEEDSPAPHPTVVVIESTLEIPQTESALDQIWNDPILATSLECIPDTAKIDGALEQNLIGTAPRISPEEYALWRQAQIIASNPATTPWRINATEFRQDVCKAVLAANPTWYSLPDGTTNLIKIDSQLRTLERKIVGSDPIAALKSYKELLNYVRMADMAAQGISGQQILNDTKQQAIANNLMSLLSDHYSQKGEQR